MQTNIPIGTVPYYLLQTCVLFYYEREFILFISNEKQASVQLLDLKMSYLILIMIHLTNW